MPGVGQSHYSSIASNHHEAEGLNGGHLLRRRYRRSFVGSCFADVSSPMLFRWHLHHRSFTVDVCFLHLSLKLLPFSPFAKASSPTNLSSKHVPACLRRHGFRGHLLRRHLLRSPPRLLRRQPSRRNLLHPACLRRHLLRRSFFFVGIGSSSGAAICFAEPTLFFLASAEQSDSYLLATARREAAGRGPAAVRGREEGGRRLTSTANVYRRHKPSKKAHKT